MSAQSPQPTLPHSSRRNALIAGIALIVIGLLTLTAQAFDLNDFSLLVLPTLAVIFLIWGLMTRTFGLIIPGGILGGLGLGTLLIELPWLHLSDTTKGGVFLLTFAAGWVLITLLSFFTCARWQWWPLIPGGILAAIGGILLTGATGQKLLEALAYVWPIALILLGLYLLVRRNYRA